MLYVVKRDGREVEFNSEKIAQAIKGSANEIGLTLKESEVLTTVAKVTDYIDLEYKKSITVEQIQNFVEKALQDQGHIDIAVAYSTYRKERTKVREIKSDLMKAIRQIGIETDRDNANVGNNFSSKLLRIASESNKWNTLAVMPKNLARATATCGYSAFGLTPIALDPANDFICFASPSIVIDGRTATPKLSPSASFTAE